MDTRVRKRLLFDTGPAGPRVSLLRTGELPVTPTAQSTRVAVTARAALAGSGWSTSGGPPGQGRARAGHAPGFK